MSGCIPPKPRRPPEILEHTNSGWTGGARSLQSITTNGYVQFRVPVTNVGTFIGINDSGEDASTEPEEIRFAIETAFGRFRCWADGSAVTPWQDFSSHDYFAISRVNGRVTFSRSKSNAPIYFSYGFDSRCEATPDYWQGE